MHPPAPIPAISDRTTDAKPIAFIWTSVKTTLPSRSSPTSPQTVPCPRQRQGVWRRTRSRPFAQLSSSSMRPSFSTFAWIVIVPAPFIHQTKIGVVLSETNPRLMRGTNYDASPKDVEGKVKSRKNHHSDYQSP